MNIKSVWVKILGAVCPSVSKIVTPLLDLATGPLGLEIKEGVGLVLCVLHYLERRNPGANGYTKVEELIVSIDGFIGITPDSLTMPEGLDALLDKMTGVDPNHDKVPTSDELASTAPPLPPATVAPALPTQDQIDAAVAQHGSVSQAKSAGAL